MRAVCALLVVAVACGGDEGTVRDRPAVPDDRPALAGGTPRSPRIASYAIEARLDDAKHQITAKQTLTWTNAGKSAVDMLPFHLYMNAFKNEASHFMRESRGTHRSATATTNSWGFIDVASIKIAGAELRPQARYAGGDETVLEVPLATPIEPGATVAVDMTFAVQLPEVFARTGYKGAFTMIGQWFPKIGVRVGAPGFERWACEPFHLTTEFFADFGTYDVVLDVPRTLVVAATGVLTKAVDGPEGRRVLTYRAEDVHDFAWMTDPYMEILEDTARVDGRDVKVRVYHRPAQRDFARRHLRAAKGTIEQMSELFVPYPWTIMSVIDPPMDAAAGAGGMEYPTLVTTAGDSVYARPGILFPEYVTVHEVGHNWFQGILASNEAEEGWLDEGVNEWADAVVMARLYGERTSAVDWMGFSAEIFRIRRAVDGDPSRVPNPIATAAWAFADFDAYASATYGKTMLALRTLENVVGRERFQAAMQAYAHRWAFAHPTGDDLFATLRDELREDLAWFVGPAFHGVGAPELAVGEPSCHAIHPTRGVIGDGDARKTVTAQDAKDTGAWECSVVVTNTGSVPVPVDVEIRFGDGSSERMRWEDRTGSHWQRFTVQRSAKITEVELDPDHRVMLGVEPLEWSYRVTPDNRAAWRAGARVGFWAQTMMSVLGL